MAESTEPSQEYLLKEKLNERVSLFTRNQKSDGTRERGKRKGMDSCTRSEAKQYCRTTLPYYYNDVGVARVHQHKQVP